MSPFNKTNQFPLFFYKVLNDNIEELTLNKVILIWADPNMKVIITIFFFKFFYSRKRYTETTEHYLQMCNENL